MEPDHPVVIARLAGVFLCALPAVRELYQYVGDPRFVLHTIQYPNSFAKRRCARVLAHMPACRILTVIKLFSLL